jgi:hypothetical protein
VKLRADAADTTLVQDWIWTFEKRDQQLQIRRKHGPDDVTLIVTINRSSRPYYFGDIAAAVRFQSDMEAFLLKTGWSFVEFSPERRTGRDRRGFPRLSERRRWWTDGVVMLKKTMWG